MIKELQKSIGKYKKESLLAPLYVMLEVILEIGIPFLLAFIIDYGLEGGNMDYVIKLGLVLVVFAVVALIFGVLSGKYAALASAGFANNLRGNLYGKVQEFSFANIDKFSTASLITRLTTDVTNVQNSYQMIIRVAVRAPMMFVFSLIMAFNVNARVSLVFLGIVPFLGIGLLMVFKYAHPTFRKVFKIYDRLNTVVQENLRGIRVVKSYVREDFEEEKFKEVSTEIHDGFVRAEKILAFNTPIMQTAIYSGILLISWLSARLIVGGSMSTGQLMSLITYSSQILNSLMMLSMVFVMITISKASAERIVEVLVEEIDLKNPENPIMEVPDGSVKFEEVYFSYGKKNNPYCLTEINLDVKSGETVGIIGGTGSSKSSLIQLIPRLYDTSKGNVYVGGINVKAYDLNVLRNEVAVVLQKNVLFSGTIKENLRWGKKDATEADMIRACKLAQAHEFIINLPDGYDTYIEQGGTNVSGGQRQRLCIARALIKDPKILILDDSTSAVDTKTDSLIRQAFKEEIPNTTKFIVAQRISSIMDADQIIVMNNGKIHDVGSHDELLDRNHIYQEVYYSQQKGGIEDEQ